MIIIYSGGVGSGKTVCAVRDIVNDKTKRHVFANITTIDIPNVTTLTRDMIFLKTFDEKTKKDSFCLNVEFWKQAREKHTAITVVLDEAHTIINARRSVSRINKVMGDFLALLRRILGNDSKGYGNLILISQLPRKIDVLARDSATLVVYHICHYTKRCLDCGHQWNEHNEIPEPLFNCPKCDSDNMQRENHIIERYYFQNVDQYNAWRDFGVKKYFKREIVDDVENYFKFYDTLQWDNLITDD